jgi:fructokinase
MEDKNLHAGGQSAGGILLPVTRHPEAGHIRPRRHELDLEPLAKKHRGCASHADCFEALASMGRLRKQFGGPTAKKEFSLLDLPDDHKMWTIEANYIAQLCYIGVLVLSPQIIILSGGIGFTDGLLGKIHDEFSALNHAHFIYPEMRTIDEFIKRGLFGPEVTVLGALQLAERASRGDPGRETRIPSSHYDNVIHIAPPKSQ